MPSGVYGIARYRIGAGALRWASASIHALLVDPGYVFSQAHRYVTDVAANEVEHVSYGRQALTGRATNFDIPLSRGLLYSEPTLFPALSGVTATGVVLYERVGVDDSTPSDDPLVCYLEFPSAFVADGTDFLVRYDSTGVLSIT